jgi:hypothetical protein
MWPNLRNLLQKDRNGVPFVARQKVGWSSVMLFVNLRT